MTSSSTPLPVTAAEIKIESQYLSEVAEAVKLLKKNSERRARSKAKSERQKRYWEVRPGLRMKLSQDGKTWWANPENRARMNEIHHSQEYRDKTSEGLRKFYKEHPELRKRLSEAGKLAWKKKKQLQ